MNAKEKTRLLKKTAILVICQIFVLIGCAQTKFKTQKPALNESFKNILSIKELVPQKMVVVKIIPGKIPSNFWHIANNINQQSMISNALEYGITEIGKRYNIREVIPILYRGVNGSYTGGFILTIELKWNSWSEREISAKN